MIEGAIYPNLGMLSAKERKDPAQVARIVRDRARADRATSVRGTARQKTKIAFADSALAQDMLLWGDRGQRRAAFRANGLRARAYAAVP